MQRHAHVLSFSLAPFFSLVLFLCMLFFHSQSLLLIFFPYICSLCLFLSFPSSVSQSLFPFCMNIFLSCFASYMLSLRKLSELVQICQHFGAEIMVKAEALR